MNKSWPHWDLNPVPSAYEAKTLTIAVQDLIYIVHLKFNCILPKCAFERMIIYNFLMFVLLVSQLLQ